MSILDDEVGVSIVRDFIELNEGRKDYIYLDPEGIPTTGIGYSLIREYYGEWKITRTLYEDFQRANILALSENDMIRLLNPGTQYQLF